MDPQTFMDIATTVTKLKMYPYFDIAHYVLMCLAVRDDVSPQSSTAGPLGSGSPLFHRKHPLSCWFSSMILCYAGGMLGALILGDPLITPFKDHQAIITASAVWYLIFYSPFDIVYKFVKLLPCKLLICALKETQRAHKCYNAVTATAKIYPNSFVIIIMLGVVKSAGSGLVKNFSRLIRGVWIPGSNEILQPSFVTKACLLASIVFLLERMQYISAPHPLIFLGVVIFFVYFKLSAILLGITDPFAPLENLFCAVFMGGIWDALKKAIVGETKEDSVEGKGETINKSKDEKTIKKE
ncbi:hypothetical protein ScPMuIL_001732 [Solemya velum]